MPKNSSIQTNTPTKAQSKRTLICREAIFFAFFLQTYIMWWCTTCKNDKYEVCRFGMENTQRLENNLCPGLGRCGADENISIKPKINQTHVLHHWRNSRKKGVFITQVNETSSTHARLHWKVVNQKTNISKLTKTSLWMNFCCVSDNWTSVHNVLAPWLWQLQTSAEWQMTRL